MADKKQNPVAGKTIQRKFWWMVTGDVQFHMGNPEEVQAATMNSILSTQDPCISSAALGRAQAGLIQRLHDTNKEAKFIPVNVVFGSISGLGQMSDEEFFGKQTVADTPPAGL